MQRPKPGDYAQHYEHYISGIKDDDIHKVLESQLSEAVRFFKSIPEEKGNYRYAENKWNIKEVIGHVADTERVYAYRAMCFGRGENKALPGFEQDDYVKEGNFTGRTMSELINEFRLLREADLLLFKSFDENMLSRWGYVEGNKITVRAILFIVAGHTQHHLKIIKEKYITMLT